MRVVLCLIAVGIIALGIWLISSGFMESAPGSGMPGRSISAPPQTASPIGLGVALLAGGVVFLVVIFRRR